jgi:hypothetical protein
MPRRERPVAWARIGQGRFMLSIFAVIERARFNLERRNRSGEPNLKIDRESEME